MRGRRAVGSGLALLTLISGACGDSGDGPTIPPATCTSGMLTLLGELDGQAVDASTPATSWSFQQLSLPHTLDVPGDGSVLHLEWTGLISIGGTGPASGRVIMPASAPHPGETICGAAGTLKDEEVSDSRTNYRFTLTDLSLGPTCPGTALAGSLAGCAATGS